MKAVLACDLDLLLIVKKTQTKITNPFLPKRTVKEQCIQQS